jgi:hypothetical protein
MPRTPSTIDQRRLRDAAHALEVSSRAPETVAEIRALLEAIHDGIAALQSLDDLGEEANVRATRDQQELWRRYHVLEQQLKDLEAKGGS